MLQEVTENVEDTNDALQRTLAKVDRLIERSGVCVCVHICVYVHELTHSSSQVLLLIFFTCCRLFSYQGHLDFVRHRNISLLSCHLPMKHIPSVVVKQTMSARGTIAIVLYVGPVT